MKQWQQNLFRLVVAVGLLIAAIRAYGQPSRAIQATNGNCTATWAYTQLYVREATGNNDGPEVERYQRVTGNHRGEAWCGSFQAACQQACGLPWPASAGGARFWFLPTNRRTFFLRGQRGTLDSLKVGDKVGFIYSAGRVGHIGLAVAAKRAVRRGRPARGFIIRAGNTGSGGGREGAGVRDVFYSAADIATASNWNY